MRIKGGIFMSEKFSLERQRDIDLYLLCPKCGKSLYVVEHDEEFIEKKCVNCGKYVYQPAY